MHVDQLRQTEIFEGLLPSANAIEVIDMFAEGKSPADVQGVLRVNGKKVSLSVIKIVYGHIKIIEDTMIRMLNSTSMVYNPPETFDENDESLGFVFKALKLPTDKKTLLTNIMFVISLEGENFANVYDADFKELVSQVSKVIDNIVAAQSGTLDDLITALKPE